MPTNIIQAIARVMEEMPAVGKDANYSGGGTSYKYRSIEGVTAAAQELMGRYCVVPVPEVVERTTMSLTVNAKPWTEEQLKVNYRFYGPGGVEDFITVGPLYALGRDNVDKGTNKAMTQAFKQALVQVFVIGDGKDDGDGERAEADSHTRRHEPAPEPKAEGWHSAAAEASAHQAATDQIKQLFALLPEDSPIRSEVRAYRQEHGWPMAAANLTELSVKVAKWHGEATASAGQEQSEAPLSVDGAPEATAPAPEAPSAPPAASEHLCPRCEKRVIGPKVIRGGIRPDYPAVWYHKACNDEMQAEQAPEENP